MYQNCCKKCGSTDLFTKEKGNNVGLYCADCGAWIKWLNKNELNAFEHSKSEMDTIIIPDYYEPKLNLNAIKDLEDCKKILKFLCDLIKPTPVGCIHHGFDEVAKYFES